MKVKFLLVLCFSLLVSSTAFAQLNAKCDYYTKYLLIVEDLLVNGKQYQDNKTATGVLCFENKRISLNNGYANGITSTYYPSGALEEEVIYIMGKKEGINTKYFEKGAIKATQTYKNNKLEGSAREYYENGAIKMETQYVNGLKQGVEKLYFENGKLDQEITYVAGAMNGVNKIYSENGEIWGTVTYKNNIPVSGQCADGRAWTSAELNNWNNGISIDCFKK